MFVQNKQLLATRTWGRPEAPGLEPLVVTMPGRVICIDPTHFEEGGRSLRGNYAEVASKTKTIANNNLATQVPWRTPTCHSLTGMTWPHPVGESDSDSSVTAKGRNQAQGKYWANLLKANGVDCQVFLFPDANHGLETAESKRFGLLAIINFLQEKCNF